MRADFDGWSQFITLVEIVIEIEKTLGETIDDAEIEGAHTAARHRTSRAQPLGTR
ncbi:hypothetical protein [Anatilimnocola aggregata]|uniref:hypothetical protein n=1 Tax=Anatilimnocola aggregata TaxID=2528021 RepID=UPI00192E3018|nr:hypothetical protein [Anatilimnocola aggregata]